MLRELMARLGEKLSGGSDPKLEEELPYAAMMITLMAASGVTPYESFKRLRSIDTLERFKEEGEEITRQVEVLGYDPLTAMEKSAAETRSRTYADFLEGYVSSVKSGGSVVNYLTSKLRNIFDARAAQAQQAVERLETLVEAYMIMLIVIFCIYILSSVTSSTSTSAIGSGLPDISSYIYPLILFVIPLFSLFFMHLANNARPGTLRGMRKPYVRGLVPGAIFAAFIAATALAPQLSIVQELVDMPLLVAGGLVAISIPPALTYRRISRRNLSAERAMPSLLRDVTEARRTGLSPEKSIVHAAARRGYGLFARDLRRMVNQIEWGVSLRKICGDLKGWIKSWPVIVGFHILVETIEIGGGNADTLGLLAEFSERTQTIERGQREMLRPYVILPFVWSVLMAFTITFTVYTMSQIELPYMDQSMVVSSGSVIVEAGIVFHCWLSGFFIGKVTEGNFASGFKYAAMLAVTAYAPLYLSQRLVSNLFRGLML
ncbi:MAG: type II secretion system F family protein [Candidatus Bathyarchaeota archaeon]|nr:type II secretion system F family protein [Candidatus Bathyarchaeota archaeon]